MSTFNIILCCIVYIAGGLWIPIIVNPKPLLIKHYLFITVYVLLWPLVLVFCLIAMLVLRRK